MILKYFKLQESAHDLVWGTANSACFDICAHLTPNQEIISYLASNEKFNTICCPEQNSKKYIELTPLSRTLIPTGIVLQIPPKHSVRIHPRSGLALKRGIVLANSEGIIDEDYTHELFIMLTNISMNTDKIYDGDRIAQGELISKLDYSLKRSYTISSKTERTGGFCSTGVNIQNENQNN
jgi:dUTP pyrophosphatase